MLMLTSVTTAFVVGPQRATRTWWHRSADIRSTVGQRSTDGQRSTACCPRSAAGNSDAEPNLVKLSLEEIASKWLSSAERGLPLQSVNREFVESEYSVTVRREGGLGIGLAELYADPDASSEKGLVLIEALVEGGNAANSKLMSIGDTLLRVGKTDVEGKDWDTTVAALGAATGEEVKLRMKRLEPKARIKVEVIDASGEPAGAFEVGAGANLRMALYTHGFQNVDLYDDRTERFDAQGNSGSNCGGEGACGTCLVSVIKGADLCSSKKGTEAAALAKQKRPARWRWSCRMGLGVGNLGGTVRVRLAPQVEFEDELVA